MKGSWGREESGERGLERQGGEKADGEDGGDGVGVSR